MASFDTRWLHAQMNLAWKLVVHMLRKLWPWAPRYGLRRFQENYVVEGLPPAEATTRALQPQPGRCTSCGACDDVCPILRRQTEIPAGDFLGPMGFVLAGARGAPHFADISDSLAIFQGPVCAGCGRCDAACPEGIPILRLASEAAAQLKIIEQARKGVLPLDDKRPLPLDASSSQA